MQKVLKYLLLWLLPLLLQADFVNWLGNYDVAHQKALQEEKPLLVLLVKKNDPLSSSIIQNTLMNHSYVKQINQKMIPVIITYEGTLSYPIEMYYTTVFPTLFFVDSSREIFLTEALYGEAIRTEKVNAKMVEIFK